MRWKSRGKVFSFFYFFFFLCVEKRINAWCIYGLLSGTHIFLSLRYSREKRASREMLDSLFNFLRTVPLSIYLFSFYTTKNIKFIPASYLKLLLYILNSTLGIYLFICLEKCFRIAEIKLYFHFSKNSWCKMQRWFFSLSLSLKIESSKFQFFLPLYIGRNVFFPLIYYQYKFSNYKFILLLQSCCE